MLKHCLLNRINFLYIFFLCTIQLTFGQTLKQNQVRTFDPPEIIVVPPFQLEKCNEDWPENLTTKWISYCGVGGGIDSDEGVDDGESEDGCFQYRLYTFTVTDACGNSDTETTRVSREYDMTNPEIVDIEDYAIDCNADWPAFLTTSWTDNCTTGGEIESDEGVDDGESEDGCFQYRLYTFSVKDNCGNTSTETTRVSREYDITNPEIVDIEDYAIDCNEDWPKSLYTKWTDNCAAGGDLESDEGIADGEEDCVQFRLYTFKVTDNCGNTSTETTRVSREYDMTNPEIVDVEDYAIDCNADWPESLTTDWTDNCASGGEIESDEGVADGEEDCVQFRLYTFTVTDNCGNTATETTRVSREYDMTNPEIVDVEDYAIDCNADWPESITTTWTDNCSAGGDLESDEGIADGEEDCVQFRLFTFTVTDNCGNIATETTRVSREYDMTNPEIVDIEDYAIDCNADWPTFLTTSWTDNCAAGGDLESDEGIADGEEDCVQFRLFTFTVTDNCGNTATETTRVSREYDMTNPEVVDIEDYAIDCNADWPESLSTDWIDNCSGEGEVESDEGVADGEEDCIQYRLYTFTVTDNCGNTATETTRVSRESDTIPPVIVDVEDYAIDCNAEWPESLTTTWTDNCASGGEIESDEGVADGEEDCVQFRLYTFTVTDNCGNTATETTRVSREYDMTNPEIVDVEDYAIDCNADWPESLTTDWIDNCSGEGEVESDEGVADGEEDCVQFRLYTFTVTDNCGNTATETTRVSREYDMTNPEIVDVEDYTLDCNEDWPPFLTTRWTDNCALGSEDEQSDDGVPDGMSEDGTIEYRLYTFSVTDNCGNTDEETTRVGRTIEGDNFQLSDDNTLFFKCITEDFEFDLFSLLIGIDSTNNNGEWYMSYGGITTLIVGGIFNPSSLLDAFGEYDEDQLGDYLFTYVLDGVCPTEAIIEIHDDCIPLDCNPIAPDTALTPNGDGIHDTFFGGYGQDARAAGCTMHLQIFNRWGVKIFEDKDYKNDWNGRVQSNAIGSSGTITTGTYFYIITYSDSAATETIKGYIYVATE